MDFNDLLKMPHSYGIDFRGTIKSNRLKARREISVDCIPMLTLIAADLNFSFATKGIMCIGLMRMEIKITTRVLHVPFLVILAMCRFYFEWLCSIFYAVKPLKINPIFAYEFRYRVFDIFVRLSQVKCISLLIMQWISSWPGNSPK